MWVVGKIKESFLGSSLVCVEWNFEALPSQIRGDPEKKHSWVDSLSFLPLPTLWAEMH